MLNFVGKWKDKITDYIDTRVRLVKLTIVERVAKVLSFFTFTIACFFLALPILLFMSMGSAEFFADLVDSRAGGYLIIAGIYALLFIILYIFRKSFTRKFTDLFVSVMTDRDDDDEEEDGNASVSSSSKQEG